MYEFVPPTGGWLTCRSADKQKHCEKLQTADTAMISGSKDPRRGATHPAKHLAGRDCDYANRDHRDKGRSWLCGCTL
jgi:hypothetical protein